MNTYAGPGGFNDPDLLIGPNGRADGTYATELQARSQVNLWSVIAAPLIISDNLLEASEYHMDTYGECPRPGRRTFSSPQFVIVGHGQVAYIASPVRFPPAFHPPTSQATRRSSP